MEVNFCQTSQLLFWVGPKEGIHRIKCRYISTYATARRDKSLAKDFILYLYAKICIFFPADIELKFNSRQRLSIKDGTHNCCDSFFGPHFCHLVRLKLRKSIMESCGPPRKVLSFYNRISHVFNFVISCPERAKSRGNKTNLFDPK